MPHKRRGLALYAPAPRGKLVIVAASAEAAARGIAPGMPLAEAKALGGPVDFEAHDPDADRAALRRLALVCQQFGPYVALEEISFSHGSKNRAGPPDKVPECLFVDITGCGPVFHGEDRLAEQAARELRRRGYAARIAIAGTPGAAWAFAHFGVHESFAGRHAVAGCHAFAGHSPSHDPSVGHRESMHSTQGPACFRGVSAGHTVAEASRESMAPEVSGIIISPGAHPTALQALPVEALRLPEETVELLRALDLCRIGQLLDLPRAELPARFGLELSQRLDQALGRRAEPLNYEKPPEPLEASWDFDDPTGDRRAIHVILEHLLEHILEKLRPRQLGVQRLDCSFKLTDGETVRFQVGLLHASASSRHLLELIRLREERLHLPAEVATATLRAPQAVPLEFQQGQIYADDARRRAEHFPALIERLSNRLGEHAVLHPRLQPDAQPEYACCYEPWLRRGVSLQLDRDKGAGGSVNISRHNKKQRAKSTPLSPRLKGPPSFRIENGGGRGVGGEGGRPSHATAPSPQPSPPPELFSGGSKSPLGGGEGAGFCETVIKPQRQTLPPACEDSAAHGDNTRRAKSSPLSPRREGPSSFGIENGGGRGVGDEGGRSSHVAAPSPQPSPPPELFSGASESTPGGGEGAGFRQVRNLLRPPCLKSRPVAVAAMSVVPDGPPLRFTWKNQDHPVARWWGPERIETGWWRGNDVRRDYYLVETAAGAQFWVFRNLDRQTWFVHGNL